MLSLTVITAITAKRDMLLVLQSFMLVYTCSSSNIRNQSDSPIIDISCRAHHIHKRYILRFSNLLILICGYANEPETKDPHRPILKTKRSQNRSADFPNSFSTSSRIPKLLLMGFLFLINFSVSEMFTVFSGFVRNPLNHD